MYNDGFGAYRKMAVTTANPGKHILMCYEGAILQLKIAKTKYREKDYEGKGKAVTKTMAIIDELTCALDFEKGGEIARNLEAIYNYVTRRVLLADVTRDLRGIDEVIGILNDLLSAWKEIIEGPGQMLESAPVQVADKRITGPLAQYMRA
jgi:flagellar secretion chaperone FliS